MNPAQALRHLGLAAGADVAAIRKAYADRLRAIDPDADVDAFVRLRDARDSALAAARRQAAQTDSLPATDPEEPGDLVQAVDVDPADRHPWVHAASRLELPGKDGLLAIPAVAWPNGPIARMAWLDPGSGTVVDLPPTPGWAFGVPLAPHLQGDPGEAVVLGRRHDAVLHGLLFPAAGDPDAAMAEDEAKLAQASLKALLTEARDGTLAVHDAIENWLAQTLANAWPRSAPLLEPAEAYFGWLNDVGKLDERPTMAFLSDRLRGLRFHDKVREPDHRLHRAWQELSSPGDPSMHAAMRADKAGIRQLLKGIRSNFPEVEHYLDAERVGWWERKLRIDMPPVERESNPLAGWIVWLAIIILIRIAASVSGG